MVLVNKGNAVQASEYNAARLRREAEAKSTVPAKRTSVGLRNALFDEIDALRRGDEANLHAGREREGSMSRFWTWDMASNQERGAWVRSQFPACRFKIEKLCDLFNLTEEGAQKILDGADYDPAFERPSVNYLDHPQ